MPPHLLLETTPSFTEQEPASLPISPIPDSQAAPSHSEELVIDEPAEEAAAPLSFAVEPVQEIADPQPEFQPEASAAETTDFYVSEPAALVLEEDTMAKKKNTPQNPIIDETLAAAPEETLEAAETAVNEAEEALDSAVAAVDDAEERSFISAAEILKNLRDGGRKTAQEIIAEAEAVSAATEEAIAETQEMAEAIEEEIALDEIAAEEEEALLSETADAREAVVMNALRDWTPDATTSPKLPVNRVVQGEAPSADPMLTFVANPFGTGAADIQNEQNAFEADLDREIEQEEAAEELEEELGMTPQLSSPEPSSAKDELLAEIEALAAEEAEREEDAPLVLEENPEEIIAQLDRIASAVADEEKKRTDSLEERLRTEGKAESETRLAKEIAEDRAIEQAMKADAADESDEDAEARAALIAAMPRMPEPNDEGSIDLSEIQSCVEALLFMSERPLSKKKLHELLGPDMPVELFDDAIAGLITRYQRACHGFELAEIAGGYQFRTKPGRAALAKKLAKVTTQRLSSGAMETLAIVAYKQPVMKEDVDQIRGVDSSHFIRTLLDRKLIRISGRSELPGRPMLYTTTDEFLEVFALKDLESMPSLREIEAMIPGSESRNPDDEDPRVKQMRELVAEMNSDTSVSLIYNPKDDDQFLTDIREKVKSIPITTQFLDEQKASEDAAKDAAKAEAAAALAAGLEPPVELPADLQGFSPEKA